jgi:hypothetical protein
MNKLNQILLEKYITILKESDEAPLMDFTSFETAHQSLLKIKTPEEFIKAMEEVYAHHVHLFRLNDYSLGMGYTRAFENYLEKVDSDTFDTSMVALYYFNKLKSNHPPEEIESAKGTFLYQFSKWLKIRKAAEDLQQSSDVAKVNLDI